MEHALKLLQVQSPEFRSLTSNRLSTQAISFDQFAHDYAFAFRDEAKVAS